MKNFPSIKKTDEFRRVYNCGVSRAVGDLVMYVCKNELRSNRIGITAARKMGNSVIRHRFIRRVREIFRKYETMTLKGWDIVVVAKKNAGTADFRKLEEDYCTLLKRCKLLENSLK